MQRSLVLPLVLLLSACVASDAPGVVSPSSTASISSESSESSESFASADAPASTILDPARVTKKPFGFRVDPATSPVQPERFAGYHTGVDFEVLEGEDETMIRVPAICDGPVIQARRVNGYGGVVIQQCEMSGPITVLYGHVADLPAADTQLVRGQTFARLGRGYSAETDNERPHLHLSVHRGKNAELRGYVQREVELSSWMDPLEVMSE